MQDQKQSEKLWHCSNLFRIENQQIVADKITQNSFAESVFFCNSGTEAVEAGIKVIRKYFNTANEKRFKIICAKNSFHGRTYAAISASGKSKLTEGFEPVLKPATCNLPERIASSWAALLSTGKKTTFFPVILDMCLTNPSQMFA